MAQTCGKTCHRLSSSYLHVPDELAFLGKTGGQLFDERANKTPEKEMYVFYADKERKTFRQVQEESQQFARALLKVGLKKGDTLGVWGGNHYEWLLAYIASMQIGVIVVHMRIDFPLGVQEEIIRKLGIQVIVLMRSPDDLCNRACQIIPELATNSADNLNCQSTPCLRYVIDAGNNTLRGTYSISDFMQLGKSVEANDFIKACEKVNMDDPIAVVFRSGSTGFPKGVTHSHRWIERPRNIFNSLSTDAQGNNIAWTSRYALIMSFGGVAAQYGFLNPILVGGTTIIVNPVYDVKILAQAIQDEKITGAAILIHHMNDILHLPNFDDCDFSSLQLCVTGGSIIPWSIRERALAFTKHLLLLYGATEGSLALQKPNYSRELLEDSAYSPSPGQEVKIIGEDGQILPVDTQGEICFRSRYLFIHYWGEEEKTRQVKTSSGWYHTGDLGTFDENGHLRITGRKAERIIKEGINIAPGDLEKVLDQHPAVNNVMVVGVPDERTSEEVCACVRLHLSTAATENELKEFCRGKVSDFLIPKYVLFFNTAFPTTATGKFARHQIATEATVHLGLEKNERHATETDS